MVAAGVIAVVAATIVLQWQTIPSTPDTSCHNPFRNKSETMVVPKQNLDLDIGQSDWPQLTSLLKEFAIANGWSFLDYSRVTPGQLTSIQVSLCAENSLRILVSENHWADMPDHPGTGLGVMLYGDVPEDVWQPVGRELFMDLEGKWPGRVRFTLNHGRITYERPEYLK
jgi:hypothetical protein